MSTPCTPNVSEGGNISKEESDALIQRMTNLARMRSEREGTPMTEALRQVAGEIRAEETTMAKINQRNALLTIQAKRTAKDFARRFKTLGDGLLTMLEGSSKVIPGARLSVDYQAKSLNGKYFGRLMAELEQAGVYHDFKSGKIVQDIYREMGNLGRTEKSVTGNEAAFKIAKIVDGITADMVARQNRAGAYITRMPGYITRQTHDQSAIRELGRLDDGSVSKTESYRKWREFIDPLLNMEKTTKGADPEKVLRNVHEALFSGIHGPPRDEENVTGVMVRGSLAKKVSESRVLHFKDPDSAYKYNEALGIREFKEAVINDIHQRARSIALMENFGPSPDATFHDILRELKSDARTMEDADKQMKSLQQWGLEGAWNELTGKNEVPANPTLNKIVGTAKMMLQLSKMGAVTLSSFADKAFMQSEMAFQGMSHLQVLGKQITGMLPRGPEQKRMLRLMGVAMDGLIGNAMSRYSSHSTVSGWAHTAQKWFFDLNLLNSWTDANKATAGELMAAHLGEHASMSYEALPGELRKVLSLYDISSSRWDALRSTAHTPKDSVGTFITPDMVSKIPADDVKAPAIRLEGKVYEGGAHFEAVEKIAKEYGITFDEATSLAYGSGEAGFTTEAGKFISRDEAGVMSNIRNHVAWEESTSKMSIAKLVREQGLTPTDANIQRERDKLETALRTYFADRIDIAIPTPGVNERRWATMNTQAGTPLGEAVRLLTLFKSFPLTIMDKILGRNVYGDGAMTIKQWLMNDHRGKFNLAMLAAFGVAAGYLSGTIRDALKGQSPKPLVTDDGSLNWAAINDAALRGGTMGILGDVLLQDFDTQHRSFLSYAAGPLLGQMSQVMAIKTMAEQGHNIASPTGKLLLDNLPYINLFYIRPVLDYFVLWNLEEMLSPGTLRRRESAVEQRNHQGYFIRPSETVNR